jgi:hypothetical protein
MRHRRRVYSAPRLIIVASLRLANKATGASITPLRGTAQRGRETARRANVSNGKQTAAARGSGLVASVLPGNLTYLRH